MIEAKYCGEQLKFENEICEGQPTDYDSWTTIQQGDFDRLKKKLEQNFRVLSEMRILGKNRVAILDFGRVS